MNLHRIIATLLVLITTSCALDAESTGTAAAAAGCITIQRGTSGAVADSGVYSALPTNNNGPGTVMAAQLVSTGVFKRALATFDVTSVPAGATVTSATLTLYVSSVSGSPVIHVRPNSASWTESTVTWATAPAYGASIATLASGSGSRTATIPTATVAGWIAGPNNGVTLESDAGGGDTFATSESTTTAQRPALTVCYATCSDSVKNGNETAVDCGGGTCSPCATGLACLVNADCTSGICTGSVCQAPPNPCTNGVKDGAETDIDCGGGTCPTCGPYKTCSIGADCRGGVCGMGGVCTPNCSDSTTNQDETDVDCGGSICSGCAAGKHCTTFADCASGFTCASGVCAAPSPCVNGVKDGAETDVDCGGGTCGTCALGKTCAGSADCASGVCGAGLCVPAGGESTTVLTTCSYAHDATILPTTYSYGSDATNMIDVYLPTGTPPSGGWPLVVAVHGGGFTTDGGGRGSSALAYFCQTLANASNGIAPLACASIDYRLMSGHWTSMSSPATNAYPAAVNDGITAQAWIVANASSLGVDTSRVAWAGFSAGGHIAAKVAESTVAPRVKLLTLYYPNLWFDSTAISQWSAYNPQGYDYIGCAAGDSACVASRSAIVNVSPAFGDAPVFISHDELDSTVLLGQSTRFQTALHAVGVNATLLKILGVNAHGYGPTFGGSALPSSCTDIFKFLQGL